MSEVYDENENGLCGFVVTRVFLDRCQYSRESVCYYPNCKLPNCIVELYRQKIDSFRNQYYTYSVMKITQFSENRFAFQTECTIDEIR